MCKAIENLQREECKEDMRTTALCMLAVGKYSFEEISAISGLSLDKVKKLKEANIATDKEVEAISKLFLTRNQAAYKMLTEGTSAED